MFLRTRQARAILHFNDSNIILQPIHIEIDVASHTHTYVYGNPGDSGKTRLGLGYTYGL